MIRNILAVTAGYAIFVVTSLALFMLSGQKPHAAASLKFQFFTAVYGIFFAHLAGFVTPAIAKATKLTLNIILAVIIAGFALFSMFKTDGSHWTQLFAIFLFAPAAVLGGMAYLRYFGK